LQADPPFVALGIVRDVGLVEQAARGCGWRKTKTPGVLAARAGCSMNQPPEQLETMNTLTRWDPFKEMDELQRRLGSIFGLAPQRTANGKEEMTVAQWLPLVDITEDDKEYLIKAELPEVKKDEVKVTVENGVLTISGERKFEQEEQNKRYHRVERAYGSFTRSFSVPDDADSAKVGAEREGASKID
jgi:HSP20 family protein